MKNIEFAEKYFRAPLHNRQPVELTRYQKALLSNLEQNPKTIIEFSRQSGVSSCLAIHIANFMIHNSNRIIAIVSPYKSAPHLLVKIRVLLEEYRTSIGMSENEFYWCNNREKIKVYGGCEVYIHTNMTRYHGSEDVAKVEMLVVDNSAHVKNLDKIEEDFKLQTRVKQIIIANTNENMSQAMRIDQSNFEMKLEKVVKPPLGLMPWGVWEYVMNLKRIEEIKDAIKRYLEANRPIPPAWITELNERNKK
jgi:hypothetical protein